MMGKMHQLEIRQLDQKLERFRELQIDLQVSISWIWIIRKALGMTSKQLAGRMGIAQPSLSRLEKNEKSGSITLTSLRRAADALGCDLVYALVPYRSLEQTIHDRAMIVAEERVEYVTHSMELESQAVSDKEKAMQISEVARELLEGSLKHLWKDA